MSDTRIQMDRLRAFAAPTQVAAVGGAPNQRAAPIRRADPQAPAALRAATPAAPADASAGSSLMGLARALGQFSPALQSMAEGYFKGVREEERNEADSAATVHALRSDINTWADAVRTNPDLADRSPYYRQIYEDRLARGAIQRRANSLHGEYWGSDIAASEDPAAIQEWLRARLQDSLEGFTSPAARASAAEELRQQAQVLVRQHQSNASRNLVGRNEAAVEAEVAGIFDTHQARGGGVGGPTTAGRVPPNLRAIYERVSREEGVPVELLIAQGYEESRFRPEVIDGRVRSPAGAIGLAQVLPSTARDPGFGLAPISEEDLLDPEKAARFQARYMRARAGGGSVNWNDPVARRLALARYGGGENPGGFAYADRVLGHMTSGRGAAAASAPSNPQGGGGAPTTVDLAADLGRIEARARAQGIDGVRLDRILATATAQAAVRYGREDYLELGRQPRADGRPGFAATAAGAQAAEQARNTILSRRVQEENLAYTRSVRSRQIEGDVFATSVINHLVTEMEAGRAPTLTPEMLRMAGRIDPDLVGKVAALANSVRGVAQQEDPRHIMELEMAVNSGQVTPQQLTAAFGTIIRDNGTATRLMGKVLEMQNTDSIFRNPVVSQLIRETQEASAEVIPGGGSAFQNPAIGVQVGNAMRDAAARFRQDNPNATQTDILAHLRAKQAELLRSYRPDLDLARASPERVSREGPPSAMGASRPASPSAAAPSTPGGAAATPSAPATVPVNPSTNWRTRPVFGSLADLENAYRAWRENPTDTANPFVQWGTAGGVRDLNSFYDSQRSILQQQERSRPR